MAPITNKRFLVRDGKAGTPINVVEAVGNSRLRTVSANTNFVKNSLSAAFGNLVVLNEHKVVNALEVMNLLLDIIVESL